MRKIVCAIVAVIMVAYFVNSYTANKAKREAEKAESEKVERVTKAAVNEMATRTNAISGWEEPLSKGERFRFEPILTVELERLWLQQKPILFIGSIKDVATHDSTRYEISVERSLLGSFDYMFETELQLSLLSKKEYVDAFLKNHPDIFKDFGFNNGVAVVAHINDIKTITVLGEEGEHEEIKIGVGELVEILYTGDVTF